MYYSQISSKKQSEIFSNVVSLKLNIAELEKGLQKTIKKNIDLDVLLGYRKKFDELIKGQKCFKHEGNYYPLNIELMINEL